MFAIIQNLLSGNLPGKLLASMRSRLFVNISKGLAWQAIGIIATFAAMPLALGYLGPNDFGIWVTVYGVITLISGFDLGVANGFRNQLAVAFAKEDRTEARAIFTNAFFVISGMAVVLILLALASNFVIYHWDIIGAGYTSDLYLLINLLVLFFGIDMALRLTGIVYTADQFASVIPIITGINNLLVLVIAFALSRFGTEAGISRLLLYGVIVGMVPLLTNLILTIIALASRYRFLLPRWSSFSKGRVLQLFRSGLMFFGIQISMMVLMQLSNVLVTAWTTPGNVTLINITDKYFGIISIVGTIILFPFWSAFTAANERREYEWIRKSIRRLEWLFLASVPIGIALLALFPWVVSVWFNKSVQVPYSFAIIILLKYEFIILNSLYSYYLNGIGKVRLQLLLYMVLAGLNVPVSYLFFIYWGATGILLFLPMAMFTMACILRANVHKRLSNQRKEAI